ncbi:MAG: bifunctional 3-(3-hydroxy-phenyl)propionate/3-hydroxycinnamic acid hydroxylase [Alphaproteobacteria bacterium]|nr:bifunctional 3-(3-hydroxy-phenyl)propionate/3-hydroxycinnamic acid hydroxylase [Alphaproteobacteria bacterium]MCW5741157.1 bifunctional 3-(3-hydroxy-phenyl)propionate/3-hydroxycinnamic acid hydroxylase [Alphaproteobacteria bacterium]
MLPTDPDYLHDVAIVGFGPTGALLANLLGRAGRSVLVLERDLEVHPLPRAVHFDGEAMRIFQSAGLAEAVLGVARPSSKGMRFVNAAGETLMERRGLEGVGPQGWVNNWYFHQPRLDSALRDGASAMPNVTVALGQEVVRLDEYANYVRLSAGAPIRSSGVTHQARYVVGCDGARSLVRRHMGVDNEDLGLHQPWLVLDLLVDPASPRAQALPDHTMQLCDPGRPMTIVHVGGRRRRWEIMLMPGDDPLDAIRPEKFWPLLSRWIAPEDAVVERAAIYTFHSTIARQWRRRRLLLAGDACHQTPPFLGQGMCAGLRDAANLAWKLDAVLRRAAPDSLLDTYGSERIAHVRAFIDLAVYLGSIIQATDRQGAAERDRHFRERGAEIFDFPQPQLGPGAHQAAPPPAGVVFPQPRLPDGRLLDEAIGWRFAVIGTAQALGAVTPQTRRHWHERDIAVIDAGGPTIEAWLAAHECGALILRPDRYVFGTARTSAELDALTSALPYAATGRDR